MKVAGFAALIRVFVQGFGIYRVDWQPIVARIEHVKAEQNNHHKLVVVDGNLVTQCEEVMRLVDRTYFITLSHPECLRRREKRAYGEISVREAKYQS